MSISAKFWPYFFVLLLIVIAASLGCWQLQRATEKEMRQAKIHAQSNLPAQRLQDIEGSKLFHRVRVTGYWLPAMAVYLDNRPNNKGQAGIEVVMPFGLQDEIKVPVSSLSRERCKWPLLLVKRGWLPRDVYHRDKIKWFITPEKLVEFEGLVLSHVGRVYEFAPEKDPKQKPLRQNISTTEFAQAYKVNTYPFVLQQETNIRDLANCVVMKDTKNFETKKCSEIADKLMRDWPKIDAGISRHYGYAFQWFSLGALMIFLMFYFSWKSYCRRSHK